jgi:hypothetical protein
MWLQRRDGTACFLDGKLVYVRVFGLQERQPAAFSVFFFPWRGGVCERSSLAAWRFCVLRQPGGVFLSLSPCVLRGLVYIGSDQLRDSSRRRRLFPL